MKEQYSVSATSPPNVWAAFFDEETRILSVSPVFMLVCGHSVKGDEVTLGTDFGYFVQDDFGWMDCVDISEDGCLGLVRADDRQGAMAEARILAEAQKKL